MLILKLAWRSLWRNRRRTLITLSSIGFGLTLALFFVSLSAGIHKKAITDATRMLAGQLTVEHPDYREGNATDLFVPSIAAVRRAAEQIPEVERVKTLVVGQGMAATAAGSAGVSLLGVEPESEAITSPIARSVIQGSYLRADDARGVVVGARLAERLQLEPGKKLVITTTDVKGQMVDELLRVTGVFEVGSEDIDAFIVQVPIAAAQRVFGLGPDQATQVGLLLRSPDAQDAVQARLAASLDPQAGVVRTWQELLPELAGWRALDRRTNRTLCGIILFIVTFTIMNTLLMSVMERKREFAMMLALGTSSTFLRLQVLVEAVLLGLLGCALGLGVGGALSYLVELRGIDLRSLAQGGATVGGFALDMHLHADLMLEQMIWLGSLIFGATLLISIYPTFRSARVDVANTLRSR